MSCSYSCLFIPIKAMVVAARDRRLSQAGSAARSNIWASPDWMEYDVIQRAPLNVIHKLVGHTHHRMGASGRV